MDIIYDTFDGPALELLDDHQPELGGPIVLNLNNNGSQASLDGTGFVKGDSLGHCDYLYAPTITIKAFAVNWTSKVQPLDQTVRFQILLTDTTTYNTVLAAWLNVQAGTASINNNGTPTTVAVSYPTSGTQIWRFEVSDLVTTGRTAKLYLNGSLLITATGINLGPPYLFLLRWDATTINGTILEAGNLSVTTLNVPPTAATAFLSPTLGVFVQYTPATGSSLSALRFEYAARAIILKGPLADQAVQYLIDTTPADLVFAP